MNGAETNGGPSGSPAGEKSAVSPQENELEKMEINAVLSLGVQGEEDSYVSRVSNPYYPRLSVPDLVSMIDMGRVTGRVV